MKVKYIKIAKFSKIAFTGGRRTKHGRFQRNSMK